MKDVPEPAYITEPGKLAWRLMWLDSARTSRATEVAIDIAASSRKETYRSPAARPGRCMTVKSGDRVALKVACDDVAEIYLFRDPPRRENIDLRARLGDGRKVTLIAAIPTQEDAFAMAAWIAWHVGVAVADAMKMTKRPSCSAESQPPSERAAPSPSADDGSSPALRWTELAGPLPPTEVALPCSRPWTSRYAAGTSDGSPWLVHWKESRLALACFLMFALACGYVGYRADGIGVGLLVSLPFLAGFVADLGDPMIFSVGPLARASEPSNSQSLWFSVRRAELHLMLSCAEIEKVHVFVDRSRTEERDRKVYELRVKLRDGRDLIMIDEQSEAVALEIARKLAHWMGVRNGSLLWRR
jgi:hypothetical protein